FLFALLFPLGAEPRALASAVDLQPPEYLVELRPASARAADDDLVEVTCRAFLARERRRRAPRSALHLVDEGEPRKLVDVPALARRGEPHRNALGLLLTLALVPVALRLELESVLADEGVASRVLADEPLRKLEDLD